MTVVCRPRLSTVETPLVEISRHDKLTSVHNKWKTVRACDFFEITLSFEYNIIFHISNLITFKGRKIIEIFLKERNIEYRIRKKKRDLEDKIWQDAKIDQPREKRATKRDRTKKGENDEPSRETVRDEPIIINRDATV